MDKSAERLSEGLSLCNVGGKDGRVNGLNLAAHGGFRDT
jgi:hypothetical protein